MATKAAQLEQWLKDLKERVNADGSDGGVVCQTTEHDMGHLV